MRGRVLSCFGDRVAVRVEGGKELFCRFRGRLRRQGLSVVAGDLVEVRERQGAWVVEETLPRRNFLEKPAVANVDQVLVVFSWRFPPLDLGYVGRVLARAEREMVEGVAVLSKADLMVAEELAEARALFAPLPYPFLVISAVSGQGLEEARRLLRGKVSVLAGQSGVGKSSLLNALRPDLSLATGELSRKRGRGRHTTRLARLLEVGGGMVADTPGFSKLDFEGVDKRELSSLFPEIAALAPHCRYSDCSHRAEPGCAVREAAEGGQVAPWRYQVYLELWSEREEAEPW